MSAADKARYDIMFHNADIDKDGFVSGQEIKGIFLQSGLPQMVLAHIWYVFFNFVYLKQIIICILIYYFIKLFIN